MVSRALTNPPYDRRRGYRGDKIVATRCPDCTFPMPFSAADAADAARVIRCGGCGAAWLRRDLPAQRQDSSEPSYLPAMLRDMPAGEGIVIEHIAPDFLERSPADELSAPKPVPRRRPFGRYGLHSLAGLGLAAAVLFGALTLGAPIVGALPGLVALAGFDGADSGLAFRAVESRTIRIHGQNSLFVEGELVNRTAGELAVPAIRASLRGADGGEVYSWLIEPSTMRLAGGQAIGFRSVLGSAPSGASEVTVRFDRRQEIGMR